LGATIQNSPTIGYGRFVIDDKTQEVLHYAENTKEKVSDLVSCGIYLFATRLFLDYGWNNKEEK
jgi:NDP-sugar pyrophosphorylase family protein